MNAVDLYHRHTMEELVELAQTIRADPANQQTGSFYLYTPQARRKLDRIGLAISWHLRDKKGGAQ